MKPDSTVIYFTVSSGTGYGIIISLLILFHSNEIILNNNIKLIIGLISLFLIISGLLSSTLHLGHPSRAWRALSQWRSSWLSREGVAAIFTFFPILFFFIFWIFFDYFKITIFLLIFSVICSIITVFCTAKIYSSLKAIPAWNNALVPILYLMNSMVLGSITTYVVLICYQININMLSNFIVLICISSLFIKLLYWYSIKKPSESNISTAIGLGNKKNTDFFEGPHTGKNFLTSEMNNKIKKRNSLTLRFIFCIITYVTPAYYIFQLPYLIINYNIISITVIIILFFAFVGMLIERYLFFIDSKHSVSLYYGNKEI